MGQSEFVGSLVRFFETSQVPKALWRRLIEREIRDGLGVLEVPGRLVFVNSEIEFVGRERLGIQNSKTFVLVGAGTIKIHCPGSEPVTLPIGEFKGSNPAIASFLAPASRHQANLSSRDLSEAAASLINALALRDPSAKSVPADWLPLALDLIRLGIFLKFSGLADFRVPKQGDALIAVPSEHLNDLLEKSRLDSSSSVNLFPGWADPEIIELAMRVVDKDYTSMSASVLGALLQNLGRGASEATMWGYFADSEKLQSLIVPLKTFVLTQSSGLPEVRSFSQYVYLDPTDSPGSILAELIESFTECAQQDPIPFDRNSLLSPRRFVAIVSNDSLAAISRMVIWYALAKAMHSLGFSHDAPTLRELWNQLDVRVGNQLETPWSEVPVEGKEVLAIVGAPTFAGVNSQTAEQKIQVRAAFDSSKVDYCACWLKKSSELVAATGAISALVLTNSVVQGEQAALIWHKILDSSTRIGFAKPAFKWANKLSGANSGVSVVVVGLAPENGTPSLYFASATAESVPNIGPYLIPGMTSVVEKRSQQISSLPAMVKGNMAFATSLILVQSEFDSLIHAAPSARRFLRKLVGSEEIARTSHRYCLWMPSKAVWLEAQKIEMIADRVSQSRTFRESSTNQSLAQTPWRFREISETRKSSIVIPSVTSESREYLPIDFVGPETIVSNLAFVIYDAPAWLFALLSSKTHELWVRLVSGGLETRIRYSNRLSYNTFAIPQIEPSHESELTELGLQIVKARANYPEIGLGDLYKKMPIDVKQAHLENDAYVASLFGLPGGASELETRTRLMNLYMDSRKIN